MISSSFSRICYSNHKHPVCLPGRKEITQSMAAIFVALIALVNIILVLTTVPTSSKQRNTPIHRILHMDQRHKHEIHSFHRRHQRFRGPN